MIAQHAPDSPWFRRVGLRGSALGGLVAVVLLATAPGLPMVWDEGNAIRRSEGIARWASRFPPNDPLGRQARPWTTQAIDADWAYTTRVEGHPAFYGILIATGRAVGNRFLAPLTAARLGPILFFGLAVGALGAWLAARFSPTAAVLGVAALMLTPRLFAHAHFASFDGPLVSGWILSMVTFDAARRRARFLVPFGLALGITLSTKATGWIAPLPLVVWALLARDRAGVKVLAIGLPLALLVFFALNPPLWRHPLDGFATFFRLNLDRVGHGWNIPTQFLGEIHHLGCPLPWYNTLLWTAVSMPVPLLTLLIVGLGAVWREPAWRAAGGLVILNAATLLVVRAMPGTPPHDGVRQFLASFPFLAALSGIGAAWLWEQAGRHVHACRGHAYHGAQAKTTSPNISSNQAAAVSKPRRARAVWTIRAGVVALYLGAATSLVWYAPHWLSYYNLLIGGLRGATAVGMEPTYYWDGLDASTLAWLEQNTPEGEKIRFAAGPTENLDWMRRWGVLTRGFRPADPGRFRWYVIQQRGSALSKADRWLLAHGTPAHVKRIRETGWGPWRLDVPLVLVYPYAEHQRATTATQTKDVR